MKPFYKYLVISVFLLGINSCCTKKDCSLVLNGPNIKIQLVNFNSTELDNAQIILTNTSFQKIETKNIYSSSFILNEAFIPSYSEEIVNLPDYAFIIKTDFTLDTIHTLDFTVSTTKTKCNTCFLADGRADVTEIQNFSFYHNGIQYFDGDTVNITK